MGLGSIRVRIFIALAMILLFWQTIKVWTPPVEDTEVPLEVKDETQNGGHQSNFQKILVTVYYEALCPDSRSFVVKHLEPTYKALQEHVEIEMVPYGKAKTVKTGDDTYEFTCQHGPLECMANMIHACTIDIIKDPFTQLEFLTCMIKNNINPKEITKTCGEKLDKSVLVDKILSCQEDTTGQKLLAKYGEMTDNLRPSITFIPTITLNKSSDNQRGILKDLLGEICKLYKVRPSGCPEIS